MSSNNEKSKTHTMYKKCNNIANIKKLIQQHLQQQTHIIKIKFETRINMNWGHGLNPNFNNP